MDNLWESDPVFICGFPKSGTTLLLALLDSHPDLLVFPEETRYFKQVLGRSNRRNPDYILSQTGAKILGLGRIRMTSGLRDYAEIDYEKYQECLRNTWEASERDDRSLFEGMIYCYGLVTGQLGSKYWVEKTPWNEKYLKQAVAMWPNMRAIYLVRDPRDNYCSYRKQREKQVLAGSTSSPLLSPEEFIAYWLESMYRWKWFLSRYRQQSLTICYEDLVQNPRAVLRRLCVFLQIEWNDSLLKPTRLGKHWSGNSMYNTEFTGISTASLGRYRDLLADEEVVLLESWLGDLMDQYGWKRDFDTIFSPQIIADLVFSGNIKPFIKLKILSELMKNKVFVS